MRRSFSTLTLLYSAPGAHGTEYDFCSAAASPFSGFRSSPAPIIYACISSVRRASWNALAWALGISWLLLLYMRSNSLSAFLRVSHSLNDLCMSPITCCTIRKNQILFSEKEKHQIYKKYSVRESNPCFYRERVMS